MSRTTQAAAATGVVVRHVASNAFGCTSFAPGTGLCAPPTRRATAFASSGVPYTVT